MLIPIRFATAQAHFCDEQTVPVSVKADGEFHEVTIPTGKMATWQGSIRRLQIRIYEHPARLDIDWIRFAEK